MKDFRSLMRYLLSLCFKSLGLFSPFVQDLCTFRNTRFALSPVCTEGHVHLLAFSLSKMNVKNEKGIYAENKLLDCFLKYVGV